MILVTGKGKLGKELAKLSSKEVPIIAISRQQMDITDKFQVSDIIKKYMMMPNYPKYLIHTAALTKPMNVTDRNPVLSLSTNIVGTANVAKACDKYGIKFIYISTDFVYNPNIPGGIATEESPLGPVNKYGWSKLGGECVTNLISNSLILRCGLCDIPFRHKVAYDNVSRSSIIHSDAADIILKVKDEVGVINVGGKVQSVYKFVSKYHYVKKSDNGKAPSIIMITEKLRDLLGE